MLQGMTWASPPDFLRASATSWQASALRLEITTLAPSFANSSAEERPMPRLEPVMTATVPERSNGGFFIVGCLRDCCHSGRASWREPGIHTHDGGYGFRAHRFAMPRNDGKFDYTSPPASVTRRR